jgi:hypothetical protein
MTDETTGRASASYGSASHAAIIIGKHSRKADAVLAPNQNIENNPMQSSLVSLAWMPRADPPRHFDTAGKSVGRGGSILLRGRGAAPCRRCQRPATTAQVFGRTKLNLRKHLQQISIGIAEEQRAMSERLVGGR